ncbi:uncharacterized protein LOC132727384 [Ruditapes philippinarum]|uniref:uncharacterized protein LOC132727384 n=1 Tax=Ruditapes philippinarum TaxID=129788 RepID=UPI00295B6EF3|nr:uncharacterized protein LOC132727384 [Ruditapes philippinarum]
MRFARKCALKIVRFIFLLQIIITSPLATDAFGCNDGNVQSWTPPWSDNRDDLYCDNECFEESAEKNCCSCNSCTSWMGEEIDLYIEELSITGKNIVLSNNQSVESNVYKIYRSQSEMKEFPVNLCKDVNDTNLGALFTSFSNISVYRDRIVLINLEYNDIEVLADISCLYKLDELNLRYNSISYLSNMSFVNLSHLRSLRLEGNKLTVLEPNTFSSTNQHLLYVDISGNQLKTLDVSNIVPPFPFCEINVASNEITEFVNHAEFTLDTSEIYGPGFINFQDNSLQKFPDLKTLLNIDDISVLGKVWDFGFDLRGIPIVCDCALQPFLSLAKDIIKALWRDYFVVECTAPELLMGVSIPNLNLSDLVCPLGADSGCQSPQCTCVDEPNKDTLIIDCSNAIPSLQHFPTIPNSTYSSQVSLNLSGNAIRYIPDGPYLSKLSNLDLSNNDIREIDDHMARKLEAAVIDLRNNDRLLRLPQTFQYRNACLIVIDDITIDCDCDSQWIAEWLKSKDCETGQFYCNVPGKGIIPASSFNVDDLDCSEPNILVTMISSVIGGITALCIASAVVIYKLRYEVLIVYLQMRRKRKENYMTHPEFLYDAYITLDENNNDSLSWVNKHLDNYLTNLGYNVFIPYRDIRFGDVRENQAIHAIERSRAVLVILTNNYFHTDDDERSSTVCEWKYAWNNFRNNRCKKIVLVNFDYVSASNISHAQVKAFLRVGSCVNFRNHDRNIMNQICEKLGEPQVKLKAPNTCAGGKMRLKREETSSDLSVVEIELQQFN